MRRAKQEDDFIIYMFPQDTENMKKWVLKYPEKETGGDLFGLWSEGENAVIHVVLGPGRECTHGDYHFYQDVSYLEKVGTLLTEDYMLGHIGEWHSHHQLRLDEPSEGDCRTVKRNFPRGSCGFFLMIANIVSKDNVKFSPYIFNEGSRCFRAGHVEVIGERSPFRLVPAISQIINHGKEAENETKEKKKEEGKEKSGFFDTVISFFFQDEKPSTTTDTGSRERSSVDSHQRQSEGMGLTGPDASTSSTSAEYKVSIPRNSFQWYSKEENRAMLKDIYCGLSNLAKNVVEITYEKYSQDMSMKFGYCEYEIRLHFPHSFPLLSATIYVNGGYLAIIYLKKCFAVQSFDSNEFLDVVENILKTKLNVTHTNAM
jgi:hypothetical protein